MDDSNEKKIIVPGGILVLGIMAIVALVLGQPKPEPGPEAEEPALMKVTVTRVKAEDTRLAVLAHGTVVPRRELDLVAQVSGQLIEVDAEFVDGGFFLGSQVLARIDGRDYEAALLTAKAQLSESAKILAEEQGRSRQAEREWRDLGNRNANALFLRKPQLAAAEAQLASAQGEVDRARLDLERTRIQAPFAGRVKQTYADFGQYVTAGSRIATVYDATAVEVRVPLTEKQAALIDLPLSAQHRAADLPAVRVRARVAGEDYEWQGVLTRTDAFLDETSRMYMAVVEVSDPFLRAPLLPGLFVEVQISGKELDSVIVLPRSALYQRDLLVTLDDANKVRHQTVEVLRKTDAQVWLRGDLERVDAIVLEKQSLVPTGATVEPVYYEGGKVVASRTGAASQ